MEGGLALETDEDRPQQGSTSGSSSGTGYYAHKNDPPNCMGIGRFCHLGNKNDCCCPNACVGWLVGICFRTVKGVNGILTYTISDASNNQLIKGTEMIDETTVASSEQLARIIAMYGNQTLYMDAHFDYYTEDDNTTTKSNEIQQVHKSWRRLQIN